MAMPAAGLEGLSVVSSQAAVCLSALCLMRSLATLAGFKPALCGGAQKACQTLSHCLASNVVIQVLLKTDHAHYVEDARGLKLKS